MDLEINMLAILISFSPWWIPIVLSIIWGLLMINSASNDGGWFAGFAQFIGFCIGLPVIWAIFFAVMYFCK